MKIRHILCFLTSLLPLAAAAAEPQMADSVDMLAYSRADGGSGLMLAWRPQGADAWIPVSGYSVVSSDFGPWGSHKKMFSPVLTRSPRGWTARWLADPEGQVEATATSADLLKWSPQSYRLAEGPTGSGSYTVGAAEVRGTVSRVAAALIDSLRASFGERSRRDALHAQLMADDPERFAGLQRVAYTVTPRPAEAKEISDMLIGIFFEDINYGADGGLYAELVQNRDFEYTPADHRDDPDWNALTAWSFPTPELGSATISTENPLHPYNAHHLKVHAAKAGYEVANRGFDGISVRKGEHYRFSLRCRTSTGANLKVGLRNADGEWVASEVLRINPGMEWTEHTSDLIPHKDARGAELVVMFRRPAKADLDMVSLFPRATFKGRPNGLRADLASTLAALRPRFVRFPGGCVAHGNGVDNIYDWKGTIGPIEDRRPLTNLWGYHQTRGLGYLEYFQFCEDLGAEPVPVLAAGVPCQNSWEPSRHSDSPLTSLGQQCGVPMEQMPGVIADILDLIEFANGSVDSPWGNIRAYLGHPEPFGLKYIGIGNEDMITEVFEERFRLIHEAVTAAYPDITLIGTVGPFHSGTDYDRGWELARELELDCVDEHYYVSPGWLIHNRDFYDGYERSATKVYLGEYASHVPGRASSLEAALSEALYLTDVERNADVVSMTSYAPLLAKVGHTQWRPDLIYFDNDTVMPTVSYYVQALYGNNSGSSYIPADTAVRPVGSDAAGSEIDARVGSSIVRDPATGHYIIKLANLLPVEADAAVDLDGLNLPERIEAHGSRLSGAPADTDCRPVSVKFPVSGIRLSTTLPPYSFTVLRLIEGAPEP